MDNKVDLNSIFNGNLTLDDIKQLMGQLEDEQVRLQEEERKKQEARLESAKKEAINKKGEAEKAQIEVEQKKTLTANLKQTCETIEEELKSAKKAEIEAAEAVRKAKEELAKREAELDVASKKLFDVKTSLQVTKQNISKAEAEETKAREVASQKEEEANKAQIKVQKLESELSGKINVQVPYKSNGTTRTAKIDQDKLEEKLGAAGIDVSSLIKDGALDAGSDELKDNKSLILEAERETRKDDKAKAKEAKKAENINALNSKYVELQAREFDLEDQIKSATPTPHTYYSVGHKVTVDTYDDEYYQNKEDLNKVRKQMKRTEKMLERMNSDNVKVNGGNIVGKIKDFGMKLYDNFMNKIRGIGEKIADTFSAGRSR